MHVNVQRHLAFNLRLNLKTSMNILSAIILVGCETTTPLLVRSIVANLMHKCLSSLNWLIVENACFDYQTQYVCVYNVTDEINTRLCHDLYQERYRSWALDQLLKTPRKDNFVASQPWGFAPNGRRLYHSWL